MTNLCDLMGLAFGTCLDKHEIKRKNILGYKSGLGLAKIEDCNIIWALILFLFVMVVKSALVLVNL